MQDLAHRLFDRLKIVRCLGAVGKIGQAEDTAQAFFEAGPGDIQWHHDEQTPR